jgi:hypothetical protein
MDLIADVLLGAGAIGAAVYCAVLSRRLRRLTKLEGGMGGAIAVLSAQVDELTAALTGAQSAAERSAHALEAQTARAESALARMELVMAALHNLPDPASRAESRQPTTASLGKNAASPLGAGLVPPTGLDPERPTHPFGASVSAGPGADLQPAGSSTVPPDDDDPLRRRARVVRRKPGWEAVE